MIDCGSLFGSSNDNSSNGRTKWNCDVDILEFLIDGFICMFPEPDCYNPCQENELGCEGVGCYLPFGTENDQPYVYKELCGKVETDDGIVENEDQMELFDMACFRAQ